MELTPHSNIDLRFEPSAKTNGKYLVLDTETTGLITKQGPAGIGQDSLPRIIQVAWLLFDEDGKRIGEHNRYILQEKPIPSYSTRIHGIDDSSAREKGEPALTVWNDFIRDIENCDYLVAHNIDFDIPVIEGELKRLKISNVFAGKRMICTMKQGKAFCKIPAADGNGFRYPDLEELYKIACYGRLTDPPLTGLHDAFVDAAVTAKVFFKMVELQQIDLADAPEKPFKLPDIPDKETVVKSKFFVNIILPTLLTIGLFLLTIYLIIIPRFRENIMLGKRQMIKELTNSAFSILQKYEQDAKSGLITGEEARKAAISGIRYLRYGEENKDYLWITDMNPDMVMHPYRNDLEGKSLKDFSDPQGKKLFVEMVRVANESGEGYVDYRWQWKDDPAHIVPKLSFVKVFKPWGWIIGTGIYIEDVNKEIRLLTRRLVFVTLAISLVIAMLLTYITLQSMKIEKKRKKAESLLKISKEKYKTLVDASSEGLIMIIDNKMIFFNQKFHELTGYNEDELLNQSFAFLLSDTNIPGTLKIFQNRELPDGHYDLILVSKMGAPIETVVVVTSILFYEKQGKLITIKDTTLMKHPEGKAEDMIRLMEFAGFGFIRILLDEKGKILYAGQSIVKMLGFENFRELSQFTILDFFTDAGEKKKYRKQLLKDGKIKSAEMHVKRKDGVVFTVSVTMVTVKNESKQWLGDGIITDITQQNREKREMEELISRLDAHAHFLHTPVRPLIRPVIDVPMETPVLRVIGLMKNNHSDEILVSNENGARVGIITSRDMIDRILLTDRNFQKPAWEVMTAPLVCTDLDATIQMTITRMEEAGISSVAVKNATGGILGLVHKNDLFHALANSFAYIETRIDNAQTTGELSYLYGEFRKYVPVMVNQDLQPVIIGESLASISDRITRRLITLAFDEIGNPPAEFAFIAMGSEGRMEQTLATDQDNAIIFEDVNGTEIEKVQIWFNKLGEIVCNNLNVIGFVFCKGRVMAKNPQWCKPLRTWKNYFSQWISNTEPKNLLDVSIFFDLRTVYGSARLTDEVRQHIHRRSDGNGPFFYNLAENVMSFKPVIGITGNIHTERRVDKDYFNLKNAVTPYIMFARVYSIFHKINLTNTAGRFQALFEMQVISRETYQEIMFGYNFLMQLRYRGQVARQQGAEEVNNTIAIQDLTEMEEGILKKILGQSSELQNKLNIDFKSTVF